MTNDQLDQLIEAAPEELAVLLGDLRPHIREACVATLEETQEEGGKAKVKVAIGLTLDLTQSPPAWTMEGTVGIRRKVTGDYHQLDDPSQPELEGFGRGTTMTVRVEGHEPVTITGEQAGRASRKLAQHQDS